MYRRKWTRPVCQTMFVIRARWFYYGTGKNPLDGETSFNLSTNRMNCYINNTIYTRNIKLHNKILNFNCSIDFITF